MFVAGTSVDAALKVFHAGCVDDIGEGHDFLVVPNDMDFSGGVGFVNTVMKFAFYATVHEAEYFPFVLQGTAVPVQEGKDAMCDLLSVTRVLTKQSVDYDLRFL